MIELFIKKGSNYVKVVNTQRIQVKEKTTTHFEVISGRGEFEYHSISYVKIFFIKP